MLKTNELPKDVIAEILLWLPVISLLRFKCVCKAWYAFITCQNFVHKHLLHNKNRNPLFLVHRRDRTTGDYLVSRLSYETLQVSLTEPVPPPHFGIDKKVNILVVGSCNGLVCLWDNFNLHIVLWNPATKETKVVPRSNVPGLLGYIAHSGKMGFGFDVETNDYKIVTLFPLCESDPYLSTQEMDVRIQNEVYCLSTNSWRKVDSLQFVPSIFFGGMEAYTNGIASWEALTRDFDMLLSFDMSKEVILITPLPDKEVIGQSPDTWRNFFVLNESVAMATYIREEGPFGLDIWLLLEYGVKESWTKIVTVGPLTGSIQTLGYGKNDTIFFDKSEGELVLYDPSTKEFKSPQIGHAALLSLQLIPYEETLVSLRRGSEFEEEDIC